MDSPQTATLVGRHVGRYRVSRHIASGGMGAVYEVVQDSIGHRAAMKVLSSSLSRDPKHRKYVDRFLDEARAVNLINHSGVLQIFDFAEMEDQTAYILMEYIEGKSLGDYLSKLREGSSKRLSIYQTMQIIRQVASVMTIAHEKGVLHRDLKPSVVRRDQTRREFVRAPSPRIGTKSLRERQARPVAEMPSQTVLTTRSAQSLGTFSPLR